MEKLEDFSMPIRLETVNSKCYDGENEYAKNSQNRIPEIV